MAVRKIIGLGTTLSVKATTASTTGYTAIGGLLSLPGPDASADDIDTSTIDNSTAAATYWKTFQRGQVDPGEMTLTLAYGSTDSSSKKLGTLLKSGAIQTWKITFGSTAMSAETFTGYVKGMGRALEKDAMVTRSVSIKVTGSPGYPTT